MGAATGAKVTKAFAEPIGLGGYGSGEREEKGQRSGFANRHHDRLVGRKDKLTDPYWFRTRRCRRLSFLEIHPIAATWEPHAISSMLRRLLLKLVLRIRPGISVKCVRSAERRVVVNEICLYASHFGETGVTQLVF